MWRIEELIVVIAAAIWIPVIKLSAYLYHHFGARLPLGISPKRISLLLRWLYWITAAASACNFLCKHWHEGLTVQTFVVGLLYLFLLVADYIENEEVVSKVTKEN
jgi:hypothetical protein